MLKAKCQ